tara:strand:- start:29 stop:205 length:177 start_codon:yes stop_codon:yes gene_type:complete
MAMTNDEVLKNLKEQLVSVSETRLKLLGAIDVLEQIQESQDEIVTETETETSDEVERN